jgi:putative Mg2+ transporter-C (MgtC) family protein
MRFHKDFVPREDRLRRAALRRGYELAGGSIAISFKNGQAEWHFVAVSVRKKLAAPLSELAAEMERFEGVENFSLSHARN